MTNPTTETPTDEQPAEESSNRWFERPVLSEGSITFLAFCAIVAAVICTTTFFSMYETLHTPPAVACMAGCENEFHREPTSPLELEAYTTCFAVCARIAIPGAPALTTKTPAPARP